MTRLQFYAMALILAGGCWRLFSAHWLPDDDVAILAVGQLRDDGRSVAALHNIQQTRLLRDIILPFGAAILTTGMLSYLLSRLLKFNMVRQHEN